MKRILSILLILLSVLVIGSCSKAEIRQAKVMTQAEIDEHNKKVKPDGDTPDDPDDPDDPDNPGGDDPSWPPIPKRSLYYVSVAGTGEKDGSSSSNALDLATFKSLVQTVSPMTRPNRIWASSLPCSLIPSLLCLNTLI